MNDDKELRAWRESQGQPVDAEPRSPFNTGRSTPESQNALREAAFATEEAGAVEASAPSEEPVAAFQDRVKPWMMACFGAEISSDKVERGDRLLEEVLELLQSGGYDPARVGALRDYVWSRPAGEPSQEAGGVQVTLAAYCLAHALNMHEAGETELARIWTKIDKIRTKQAAKPAGSALPVASPAVAPGMVEAATELVDFAWSAVVTDCTESAEYLNELVEKLRAALAAASQRSVK